MFTIRTRFKVKSIVSSQFIITENMTQATRTRIFFNIFLAVSLVPIVTSKTTCRLEDIKQSDGSFVVPSTCSKLALGGAEMGDDGVVSLAAALSVGGLSLNEVHVPTTKMGPRGAKALASYLVSAGSTNSLRILNM